MINLIINKFTFIKWNKSNYIPVLIQEILTKNILMFAWLNKYSFIKTLIMKVSFLFSRSKFIIWCKGFTSFDIQFTKYLFLDCDIDCVLIKTLQINNNSCHLRLKTCFINRI